jgi:mono/diheme cytochrome c family protein
MKRVCSVFVLSVWQIAGIAALLAPPAADAASAVLDTRNSSGPAKASASAGERIYIRWCAECHGSAVGPGTQVLEQRYKGQVPAILHERTGIPAELVKLTVRRGVGFMAPFRKTEISDSELASLATYLSTIDRGTANKQAGRIE